MTITEADWELLDAGGGNVGYSYRRLHPLSPQDLRLVLYKPRHERSLALKLDTSCATSIARALRDVRSTHGIRVQLHKSHSTYELQLVLEDKTFGDVFNVLIDDISTQAAAESNCLTAAGSFIRRYEEWVELLRAVSANGMSDEARIGLVSELLTLKQLLEAGEPPETAVVGWTGPKRTDQDFQLPFVSIEVKATTARQPQSIAIASERQLDPIGQNELLLVLYALDERRGGHGWTLNSLSVSVREQISPVTRPIFDDLLVRAGYLPHQAALYEEPRYTIREERYYRLHGNYPRVTEDDLREGVGSCSYRISVSALQPWLVPRSDFLGAAVSNTSTKKDAS